MTRRRRSRAQLQLLQADDVAEQGEEKLREVTATDRLGFAISVGALVTHALQKLNRDDEALPIARRTLALLESHVPDNLYREQVWHACLPVVQQSDPKAYRAVLTQARIWIEETAQERVPAQCRESFLERNPFNRDLRRLAAHS